MFSFDVVEYCFSCSIHFKWIEFCLIQFLVFFSVCLFFLCVFYILFPFRTSLFIITSLVYAMILIVICIAYVISDVSTHRFPVVYYEGYFTYLYGASILFLLYVFCFLLQGKFYRANSIFLNNGFISKFFLDIFYFSLKFRFFPSMFDGEVIWFFFANGKDDCTMGRS